MSTPWLPLDDEHSASEVDVIVFPHAGASADAARPLLTSAPPWLSLRPVELPGRGRRMMESPEWSLRPLVAELAEALEPRLTRPTLFFGHSMGALLAFETARALPEARKPKHLVLTGHRGPQLDRSYLRGHEGSDAEFIEELRKWNGKDAAWLDDEDLRSVFLPVLRADFRALIAYRFEGRPVAQPTTAVRGEMDPFLDEAGLEAWREVVSGPFETHVEPGDHFFWSGAPRIITERLQALGAAFRPGE